MGRLNGKVALVTGAARGQGRSHALRLAQEGADVVALDVAGPLSTVKHYRPSTLDDLKETVRLIEAEGRRGMAQQVDVRDRKKMDAAAADALTEFEHIDIVIANAGITTLGHSWELEQDVWQEMIDINLTGVWNSVAPLIPSMIEAGRGGSIVMTSSVAGTVGIPGLPHYVAAKHGVVGLMRALANELAIHNIRVNTVSPTNVGTEMILNDRAYEIFRPDLEKPSMEDAKEAFMSFNLLKVPYLEPSDVSNAIAWLVSDEARFMTGVNLPVDCGATAKFPGS